jgi:hypothetical protein
MEPAGESNHDPKNEEQEAQENERMICPKCGSHDVRPSHAESFVSTFFRMFGQWPFRCRSCRARFYRSSPPPEEDL